MENFPDQMPSLTNLETKLLQAIPDDDFFENGLDSILWTDVFLDGISMDSKTARGVLTSLEKKDMLNVDGGKDGTISLTDRSKAWVTHYLATRDNVCT